MSLLYQKKGFCNKKTTIYHLRGIAKMIKKASFDQKPSAPASWGLKYRKVLITHGFLKIYPWWAAGLCLNQSTHRIASHIAIFNSKAIFRPAIQFLPVHAVLVLAKAF